MHKSKAIELLGGTITSAAKEIGVTYQAIDKWPDELPPRLADRVLAAVARKRFPELADDKAAPDPEVAHAKAVTDRRTRTDRRQGPRRGTERRGPSLSRDKPTSRKGRGPS